MSEAVPSTSTHLSSENSETSSNSNPQTRVESPRRFSWNPYRHSLRSKMSFRHHQEGGDICAIFVHAGAGYHSHANEKLHLMAVEDASKVAMTVLRAGGEAVDAVEMAIKLLEDREITNAGYGSNLTMSGEVECDATMVDHFGRSGAVGAVSQIRNPIGLARVVLDASTKPLSLQRVPPNLLVGQGAQDFANDHGMPILPPDFLVSRAAKDRWMRWKQDLENAQEAQNDNHSQASWGPGQGINSPSLGTAFSPPTSPVSKNDASSGPLNRLSQLQTLPLQVSTGEVPTLNTLGMRDPQATNFTSSSASYQPSRNNGMNPVWEDQPENRTDDKTYLAAKRQRMDGDGSADERNSEAELCLRYLSIEENKERDREDHITDTVGAIAVDCFGNIAAGSSSGGIGMKYRGRCGPAALVGIGTAVKPIDPSDLDKVCVATVTSGTGEHMATTMAAATVADRIYHSVRKISSKRRSKKDHGEEPRIPGLENCDEDEAMKAMIKEEFMKHPGVKNSHCAGAIGIMAVKKTKDGIYFYFGHNTDSFALASLHSEEQRANCVMSRSNGNGSIAQGGRAVRHRRGKH